MKILDYDGLVGFILLTVFSLAIVNSATAIEKAKYTVVEKEDAFELRQYEAQIVAETYVEGSLKDSGNDGFRRLYAYITGDNKKKIYLHDRPGWPGSRFGENCHDGACQSGEKGFPMAHYISYAGRVYPGNASGT